MSDHLVPVPAEHAALAGRLRAGPLPADPAIAAEHLDGLLESAPELAAIVAPQSQVRALLEGLADGSPFLWQLIAGEPSRAAALLAEAPETSLRRILGDARTAAGRAGADQAALMADLRRARQELALVTALADLGGVWDVGQVTAALSDFADAAISAALRFLLTEAAGQGRLTPPDPADPERGSGLIVLAMGKHGARELNYSSDIDLIAFYDPETAPLAGDVEPGRFFVRLVQRLVTIMQERTADGYVFRTDLRLRPDPGSTAVAISRNAAMSYYESVGQNWERAALLKARPCAGDIAAGEVLLRELAPFIWRKYLDYGAIADVHAMKRQIHVHRGHGDIAVAGHNVKLGRGGIREIEFFVQTQQLIAGGRNPALRVRGTEEALAALTAEGWVDEAVRAGLVEAYRFLRGIEHRLQMVADEQTHTLPEDPARLAGFARFAGYETADGFAQALLARLGRVQDYYAHLFEDAPPLASAGGSLVFTGDEDDPETLDTLRRMGFAEPARVSNLVRGWHHGRVAATRSARARELLTELVPGLLDAIGRTADPEAALRTLNSVMARLPAGVEFFSLLRSNASFLSLLADALGSAPRLGELLGRRPHVLDGLMEPAFFARIPEAGELADRLDHSLAEADGYEDLLDRVRIFGQEQIVLIGFRVLSGQIGADRAGAAFARLADLLIARLHQAVEAELVRIHGAVPGGRSSVVALGKLGGREMTAASDLDLMLIYEHDDDALSGGPRPLAASQFYARLTQRLVAALSAPTAQGTLYEVDFRLRPSGHSGPIATRLAAFTAYQASEAWTWEHMALTRARLVSGPPEFRAEVGQAITAVLGRPRDPAAIARDVWEMRTLIAREKGEDDPWELKYASGGLIDIEFVAQYLQLVHASRHPDILDTSTAGALERARRIGLIEANDWEALRPALRLQHDLTQILRLCLPAGIAPEAAGEGVRALLCRAATAPNFSTLEATLKDMQAAARLAVRRILEPPPA